MKTICFLIFLWKTKTSCTVPENHLCSESVHLTNFIRKCKDCLFISNMFPSRKYDSKWFLQCSIQSCCFWRFSGIIPHCTCFLRYQLTELFCLLHNQFWGFKLFVGTSGWRHSSSRRTQQSKAWGWKTCVHWPLPYDCVVFFQHPASLQSRCLMTNLL